MQTSQIRYFVFTLLLIFGIFGSPRMCAATSSVSVRNARVIRQIYASFESGDVQKILDSMDDSVVWIHPGRRQDIPFAGEFKGKDGVKQFFDIVDKSIDVVQQHIYDVLAQRDKVAVVGFEKMRVKLTGCEYQSNWVHLYTLKDGKVVHFEEYIDTAALKMAFDRGRRCNHQ